MLEILILPLDIIKDLKYKQRLLHSLCFSGGRRESNPSDNHNIFNELQTLKFTTHRITHWY